MRTPRRKRSMFTRPTHAGAVGSATFLPRRPGHVAVLRGREHEGRIAPRVAERDDAGDRKKAPAREREGRLVRRDHVLHRGVGEDVVRPAVRSAEAQPAVRGPGHLRDRHAARARRDVEDARPAAARQRERPAVLGEAGEPAVFELDLRGEARRIARGEVVDAQPVLRDLALAPAPVTVDDVREARRKETRRAHDVRVVGHGERRVEREVVDGAELDASRRVDRLDDRIERDERTVGREVVRLEAGERRELRRADLARRPIVDRHRPPSPPKSRRAVHVVERHDLPARRHAEHRGAVARGLRGVRHVEPPDQRVAVARVQEVQDAGARSGELAAPAPGLEHAAEPLERHDRGRPGPDVDDHQPDVDAPIACSFHTHSAAWSASMRVRS